VWVPGLAGANYAFDFVSTRIRPYPSFPLRLSSRNSAPGLDLYGRSTDSVWFHIPEARRLKIILFLMGNIVFQICLQICACVYYSYALDKSTGGTITGLLFMLLSIGCAICGAVHQTNAEHDMHKQAGPRPALPNSQPSRPEPHHN
jgi:hypothetical protein